MDKTKLNISSITLLPVGATFVFFAAWWLLYFLHITVLQGTHTNQLLLDRGLLLLFILIGSVYLIKQGPAFFAETAGPYTLAFFRIVFYGFVSIGFTAPLYLFNVWQLNFPWAEIPAAQRVSLPFMDWYVMHVPVSAAAISIAVKIIAISAMACMLGFGTRFFSIIFLVATFYVNGFSNFFGKVNHNHYIIWFAAIMCFAPSADVLSIDAVILNRRGKQLPNRNYGLAPKIIMLLLGIIYFFPGFHKIWASGLDWALTDNVRNQMYFKWFETDDWTHVLRIDKFPGLYHLTGMFTLAFELGFLFWIIDKRSRLFAVFAGFVFHLAVYVTLGINFFYLLLCYIVLIDWDALLDAGRPDAGLSAQPRWLNNKALLVTGIVLVFVNSGFGFLKINSYPFSCFPTFENIVGDTSATLIYKLGGQGRFDKKMLEDKYGAYNYRQWEFNLIQRLNDNDSVGLFAAENLLAKKIALLKAPADTIMVYVVPIKFGEAGWWANGPEKQVFTIAPK